MYNNAFTHNGQSIVWAADNIAPGNMLFYPLYHDISLMSLKITEAFTENQTVFCDFKI